MAARFPLHRKTVVAGVNDEESVATAVIPPTSLSSSSSVSVVMPSTWIGGSDTVWPAILPFFLLVEPRERARLSRRSFRFLLCRKSIPNSIERLSTNLDPCNYDISNMGPREDVVGEIYHGDRGGEEEEEEEEDMEHGQLMKPVNSMSLLYFRRQLVKFIFRLCLLAI